MAYKKLIGKIEFKRMKMGKLGQQKNRSKIMHKNTYSRVLSTASILADIVTRKNKIIYDSLSIHRITNQLLRGGITIPSTKIKNKFVPQFIKTRCHIVNCILNSIFRVNPKLTLWDSITTSLHLG